MPLGQGAPLRHQLSKHLLIHCGSSGVAAQQAPAGNARAAVVIRLMGALYHTQQLMGKHFQRLLPFPDGRAPRAGILVKNGIVMRDAGKWLVTPQILCYYTAEHYFF